MKQPIKQLLGQSLFAARLDRLLLKNTATVVAFHRVEPTTTPDALTVTVKAFERYCRFFKERFQVVPLAQIVERLERGQSLTRHLAITFDDGYLDNFEHAAPILEKHSLPATFFVVTRWIGTDVVPWWDRDQGVRYPWMTWAHVRRLSERGFDIGAHTRTHADLGAVDGLRAWEEILGARHDLTAQLDAPADLFAYPYGRLENLTFPNREIVKDAGFQCCCSCFGGAILPATDPFQLSRVPITRHDRSPQGFGLDVALGRDIVSA